MKRGDDPRRHPAFMRRYCPKSVEADPSPHAITDEEHAYLLNAFESGGHVSMYMVRKLLRLYKERTAACLALMRQLDSGMSGYGQMRDPNHNPEMG
jgi:hypothetical protein